MRIKVDLNPCPFCGAAPHGLTYPAQGNVTVQCSECAASVGNYNGDTEVGQKAAASAWNRRATLARAEQPDALVAALEQVVAWFDAPATEYDDSNALLEIANSALAAHRDRGQLEVAKAEHVLGGESFTLLCADCGANFIDLGNPHGYGDCDKCGRHGLRYDAAAAPHPAPEGTQAEAFEHIHLFTPPGVRCGANGPFRRVPAFYRPDVTCPECLRLSAPAPHESADLGALLVEWDAVAYTADERPELSRLLRGIVQALRSAQGAAS
jgi:Lar family restriction alleviation protein